ncbi:hypothetical protein Spb1_04790 [Planctopirus ephydatiae]|uniref:Uncharacterized protein n=1 Tax=Planctopirus ephydatiae TaxID=2528019 RepID=A0A518GJ51_9PLAN|nr:hypothetical protein Spb1_04790 [Planctopirus ephydatiae]
MVEFSEYGGSGLAGFSCSQGALSRGHGIAFQGGSHRVTGILRLEDNGIGEGTCGSSWNFVHLRRFRIV